MSDPYVSVIIASYNVAPYIQRAVESALVQQGVTLEVIVVDDCSSDGTPDIVAAITDRRVKLIQLKENSGPSGARNAAIKAASGQWIAILDGDDAYEQGRLQRMTEIARIRSADMIVDNILVVSEELGKNFPMFDSQVFDAIGEITLPRLMNGTIGNTGYSLSSLKPIYSKSFLNEHNILYDESIAVGEDYMIFAECLAYGARCVTDSSFGYLYTRRAGSISYRIPSKRWQIMIDCETSFMHKHNLQGNVLAEQQKRLKFMRKMKAFEMMVEAIKVKDISGLLKPAIMSPTSVLFFAAPIKKRIQKLLTPAISK